MQTLQGAALIGKDVIVAGNKLDIDADGVAQGGFELAAAADAVKVEVLNAAGTVIDTVQLGASSAGVNGFDWAAGNYDNSSGLTFRVDRDERRHQARHDAPDARHRERGQHLGQHLDARTRPQRLDAVCVDQGDQLNDSASRPKDNDMSFQQGLSGLNASSKNLEVIGNNVANANTVGAKASRAEFADMYASALNGAGTTTIGIGVNLAAVTQQFTQGNITTTENPLDLAINGNGFFEVTNGIQTLYTRNGQFQANKDGYIVNSTGMQLMGYPADDHGRDPARRGARAAAADRRHRAERDDRSQRRDEPRLAPGRHAADDRRADRLQRRRNLQQRDLESRCSTRRARTSR